MENGEGSGALRRTPHSQTRSLRKRCRSRYQPACKPGSVGRTLARPRDGHSSGTMLAHCLEQPTRTASLTSLPRRYRFRELPALPSLFGLAPGGVCRAAGVAVSAVGSYPTLSLSPDRSAGDLLSVALSLGQKSLSGPPAVNRHRRSVEPGLSSPPLTRGRGRPVLRRSLCKGCREGSQCVGGFWFTRRRGDAEIFD